MYSGHGAGLKFYEQALYAISNKNNVDWLERMKSVEREELGVK